MIRNGRAEARMAGCGDDPSCIAEAGRRSILKEEFLRACAAAFDRVVPAQDDLPRKTFTEIEREAGGVSRGLAVALCRQRLAADPLADPGRSFLCPRCRRPMRVQSNAQRRTIAGVAGGVEAVRPYCVCDACRFACAPLDYVLGIPPKGPSVGRRELVCDAATRSRSFAGGSDLLSKHSNLPLTAEAVRKLAESEGRRLVETRAERVEHCFRTRGRLPDVPAHPVPFLVVVCDGGRVQTRNTDPDRRWKCSKIGSVYDAQPHPDPHAATAEKYRGAAALTKTYTASMKPWEDFGRMLFTEACGRGYMDAQAKLFLSDAEEGIMSLRDLHFSDAHPIIDWYHAAEHIADCAKATFGRGTPACTQWFESNKDRLWHGGVKEVIEAIRTQSDRLGRPPKGADDSDPRLIVYRNIGYFSRNCSAMNYPAYRAKGWPIGSGVAEGSVKQFGLRVKGSEQFWNLWGAEEMLALCELYHSQDNRWDRYWRRRGTPPEDARVFLQRPRRTGSPSQ